MSQRSTIEDWLGLSYDKPASHMREYLEVLRPLLNEEGVDFSGELFRVNAALQVPDAFPCPVLVSALGPRMLDIAGELGDGAIVWMTGPRTIETHVAPRITAAASRAGQPPPRVCVGVAVAVTDDPAAARDRARRLFRAYDMLPSYRRMLEAEGVQDPADLAIVGNESEVEGQLRSLADAGATDLLATVFPVDEGQVSPADPGPAQEPHRTHIGAATASSAWPRFARPSRPGPRLPSTAAGLAAFRPGPVGPEAR